jgi:hypothetical protein
MPEGFHQPPAPPAHPCHRSQAETGQLLQIKDNPKAKCAGFVESKVVATMWGARGKHQWKGSARRSRVAAQHLLQPHQCQKRSVDALLCRAGPASGQPDSRRVTKQQQGSKQQQASSSRPTANVNRNTVQGPVSTTNRGNPQFLRAPSLKVQCCSLHRVPAVPFTSKHTPMQEARKQVKRMTYTTRLQAIRQTSCGQVEVLQLNQKGVARAH